MSFFAVMRRGIKTYMKYPLAIQDTWSVEPNALPMMYKLAASVVWSMSARRSTLAQARKICRCC